MVEEQRSSSLWMHFSDEEKTYLEGFAEHLTLAKGDVVIEPGVVHSSLYVILKGTVRVLHVVSGRELILASLGEGQTLGELSFIESGKSSATCRALTDVALLRFDRAAMDRISEERPVLAARIWHVLALELKHRLLRTNENLASFFNISQTLTENEQFRVMYGNCFR
ncbi:MAG TPA: cyclic nucleotide-binding domain-containing protein [Thermoanaerobaculia bacterium]|nr:cyclic nucleotide-binding domain-containing protein [Thermoanaerobaculia bacterium]HUM30549.1 cyclic nucleotide-binding domain-containing protein [Thermoanaerobaculia bacterium]HXK68741.1 cyclic nucleotide-binding domain-containing protein [Thermoanaerobaculia bacterium]